MDSENCSLQSSLHQQQQQQQQQLASSPAPSLHNNNNTNTSSSTSSASSSSSSATISITSSSSLQKPLHSLPIRTAPKLIIHERENSREELEALFDPQKWTKSSSYTRRNLPYSFFKPPETGTRTPNSRSNSNVNSHSNSAAHSRQNSIDEQNLAQQQIMQHRQNLLLQQRLQHLNRSNTQQQQQQQQQTLLANSSTTAQFGGAATNPIGSSNNINNNHARSISEPVQMPMPSAHQSYFNNQLSTSTTQNNSMPPNSPFGSAGGPNSPGSLLLPQHNINNSQHQPYQQYPLGWRAFKTPEGKPYYVK